MTPAQLNVNCRVIGAYLHSRQRLDYAGLASDLAAVAALISDYQNIPGSELAERAAVMGLACEALTFAKARNPAADDNMTHAELVEICALYGVTPETYLRARIAIADNALTKVRRATGGIT